MARIVTNYKGFKTIEISRQEMLDKLSRYGSLGLCDTCVNPAGVGYYVAVLNRWLCKDCYEEFVRTVDRYENDKAYEDRNFDAYCRLFRPEPDTTVADGR